jgi:hypothetical protein
MGEDVCKIVRLALKFIMQNGGEFVDVIQIAGMSTFRNGQQVFWLAFERYPGVEKTS